VRADRVNTRAIAVMKEDGVDISQYTSNSVDEYAAEEFDFVLTVCEDALEKCPYFPARVKNIHHDFPDPATASGSEEEIMNQFRMVRDMIRKYARQFVQDYVNVSS
jgi:arsenate reductase